MGIKISDLDKATSGDLTDDSIIPTVVGAAGSEATKGAELGDVSDTVITNLATGSSTVATTMRTALSDTVITNLVTGTSPTAQEAMVNLSTSVAANMGSGIVTQTNADIAIGDTSVFVNDPGAFTVPGSITVGSETRTILAIDSATGEITFADPLTNACTAPCQVGNPAAGMSGAGITAGTITAGSLAADGTVGSIASPTGGLTLTPQGLAVNPTPSAVTIYINATGDDYVKGTSHQTISTTTHGPTERFTSLTHAHRWASDNIGSSTVQCNMIVESDIIEPPFTHNAIRTTEGRFGKFVWISAMHEAVGKPPHTLPPADSDYPKITFPKDDSTDYYNRVAIWLEHAEHWIRGLHLHFEGGSKNDEYCMVRSIAGRININESKFSLGVCTATGGLEGRRLHCMFEAVESGSIRITRGVGGHNNFNWLNKTGGSSIDKKNRAMEIDISARPVAILFSSAQNSQVELGVEFAPAQHVSIPNGHADTTANPAAVLQHSSFYSRVHFAGTSFDCREIMRADVSSFINSNSLPTVGYNMANIPASSAGISHCVTKADSFSTVTMPKVPSQYQWHVDGAIANSNAPYQWPKWPAGRGFHSDITTVGDTAGRDNDSTYVSSNVGFYDPDNPVAGDAVDTRSTVSTTATNLEQVADW